MTTVPSSLDARLAALREVSRADVPPPETDRAIAMAIAGARRRQAGTDGVGARWLAWPLALAASIAMLSVIVRSSAPAPDPVPTASAAARAGFLPVVPMAELERTTDALVVPARVSRITLAQFGLPVNPARMADAVETELLVRPDGAVLAVRFVN